MTLQCAMDCHASLFSFSDNLLTDDSHGDRDDYAAFPLPRSPDSLRLVCRDGGDTLKQQAARHT